MTNENGFVTRGDGPCKAVGTRGMSGWHQMAMAANSRQSK